MRTRLTHWTITVLLAVVAWFGMTALYAAHLFLFHTIERSAQWREELSQSSLNCAAWLLIAPLLLWASRLVVFSRSRPLPFVAFHLPASLLAALLQVSVHTLLDDALHGRSLYSPAAAATFVNLAARTLSFGVIAYWTVIIARQVVDDRRRRDRAAMRLDADLAHARLLHLQSQLHPHFLFNTLHSVAALIDDDPRKAQEMIASLGELLRHALDSENVQELTLRDELGILEKYLEIERVRFTDRLTIRSRIANDALDGLVPTLILQPLVENAVRHGFMKQAGVGHIEIEAERIDGRLRLVIRDDGPGIANPETATRRGRATRNTSDRLEQLYGSAQAFFFRNISPHGTEMTVELPYHTKP